MQPCSQQPRLAAYIDFFLNYIMVALSRIWAKSHILKGWRLSKWSIFSHIKLYFIGNVWQFLQNTLGECVRITACPYNFIKHKCVRLLYSSPCHLKYLTQIYYAAYVFFRTYDFNRAQQWPLTFASATFSKSIFAILFFHRDFKTV